MKKEKKVSFKEFLKKRNTIQMFATLLTNIHLPNFLKGILYNGKVKQVCVPGLNCYSCPAATGTCPIGAFQAVVGSSKFSFSYYITGILIFFGIMLGNKVSLLNYNVDKHKCVSCGKCSRTCKMDVDITKNTSHTECIRCGECIKVCPTKAISVHWGVKNPVENKEDKIINKIGEIKNENN